MIQETIEECFAKSFKDNLYKVQYYAYSYLKNRELAENIAGGKFKITNCEIKAVFYFKL